MQYMLMIYASEARFSSMSKESVEEVMQAYGAYTKDIFANAKAGDCAALEGSHTATTVQIRDGKRIVKDGPFAETREQLGGYYTLEVGAEEEALAWAAKIPDAKGGTMEVRPVIPMQSSKAPVPTAADTKGKKEYMLLIYEAESQWEKLTDAQRGTIYGGYKAFGDSIKESHQFVAGDQLDRVRTAKCVRVDGTDKRVVKDGPFAETREQLGGYYRVWAKDLDEAVGMAARIPAAETGTIEVRPIRDTSAYK